MSFEGLSTIFEASNECFLQYKFTYFLSQIFNVRDNTCTKVTCKILSSHNKAIKHTYNGLISCVAKNYTFTFLTVHVRV